jgi:hypothetical protein
LYKSIIILSLYRCNDATTKTHKMTLLKKELKLQNELKELSKKFGYWSNEVLEFNSNLDNRTMLRINDNLRT